MSYTSILKRTGAVLIVVGLLDIAAMVYCIANGVSYSSSFNVVAVIAGAYLFRGSLGAASIVRVISVFMLAALTALLFAWPFIQPFDLTATEVRLAPTSSAVTLLSLIVLFALLFWLSRELGRAQVIEAQRSAGRKARDMRIPVAVGVGVVLVLVGTLSLFLGGESALKAKLMAQQQLGEKYRYHVSSLNIMKSSQGTYVSGVVTAWNEKEVRTVSVKWEEH